MYITELSSKFYEESLRQDSERVRQDKLIAELRAQLNDLDHNSRVAFGILNGLLDHLGVEYHKTLEPDLMFAPAEPRMREVVRIRPARKPSSKKAPGRGPIEDSNQRN